MRTNPTLSRPNSPSIQPDLRAQKRSMFRRGFIFAWLRVSSLIALDALLLSASWWLSNSLGTPLVSHWRLEDNPYSFIPVVLLLLSIIAAKGLYASGESRRDYIGIVKTVALGNLLLLLTAFIYEPQQLISRSHFVIFFVLSATSICLSHYVIDLGLNFLRQKGFVNYPVFLIADREDRDRAVDLIETEKRYFIRGIGSALSLDRDNREHTFERLRRLGISEAFVTWGAISRRLFLAWHFQSRGITLRIIPEKGMPISQSATPWVLGGLPALSFDPSTITGVDFRVKNAFDFVCSLVILLLAAPVYIAIALAIKLDDPGPIFYRQTRIGLHGQPFKAWKFRSMVTNADKLQKELEALNKTKDGILFKIEDDPRITRVGKFLRKYSLDELPQIFNVLAGEMSLVGPRPLPVRDVEQFSEHHFIRHEVLPGITGLWQVSGRSDIDDFEHVLRLDLTYIENWSLWLDFSILLRTVGVVFKKSGAY